MKILFVVGKENLQEYVAKKREIFFVQMSLDTKRAEIRKLEERIFQREEVCPYDSCKPSKFF